MAPVWSNLSAVGGTAPPPRVWHGFVCSGVRLYAYGGIDETGDFRHTFRPLTAASQASRDVIAPADSEKRLRQQLLGENQTRYSNRRERITSQPLETGTNHDDYGKLEFDTEQLLAFP